MSTEPISLFQLTQNIKKIVEVPTLKEVWVRCEITEFNDRSTAIYVDLTESKDGKLIAKQKAIIWRGKRNFILDKFLKGTGSQLQKGLQVLFCVTVEHNPLHGLSVIISDVDPSFTVGQLQMKIQEIKNFLTKKNCFTNNHAKKIPMYFERVAVLTPAGSAGEGDFKKDADKLEKLNLCNFVYYNATMQGLQAEESMSQQIANINNDHKVNPFDALIIIRGGGAVADLSWLNNKKSAHYICMSLMPVITGLGHERDICVLDEVAKLNAGTPSKCVELITKNNVSRIQELQRKVVEIKHSVFLKLTTKQNEISNAKNNLKMSSLHRITSIIRGIGTQRSNLNGAAINATNRTQVTLGQRKNNIKVAALSLPSRRFGQVNIAKQQFKESSVKKTQYIRQNLKKTKATLNQSIMNRLIRFYKTIRLTKNEIKNSALMRLTSIQKELSVKGKELILYSPLKVLGMGYGLVRNNNGKVISNADDANNEETLTIDFKDGNIAVQTLGVKNERITTN